jgi:hypothetical protein
VYLGRAIAVAYVCVHHYAEVREKCFVRNVPSARGQGRSQTSLAAAAARNRWGSDSFQLCIISVCRQTDYEPTPTRRAPPRHDTTTLSAHTTIPHQPIGRATFCGTTRGNSSSSVRSSLLEERTTTDRPMEKGLEVMRPRHHRRVAAESFKAGSLRFDWSDGTS